MLSEVLRYLDKPNKRRIFERRLKKLVNGGRENLLREIKNMKENNFISLVHGCTCEYIQKDESQLLIGNTKYKSLKLNICLYHVIIDDIYNGDIDSYHSDLKSLGFTMIEIPISVLEATNKSYLQPRDCIDALYYFYNFTDKGLNTGDFEHWIQSFKSLLKRLEKQSNRLDCLSEILLLTEYKQSPIETFGLSSLFASVLIEHIKGMNKEDILYVVDEALTLQLEKCGIFLIISYNTYYLEKHILFILGKKLIEMLINGNDFQIEVELDTGIEAESKAKVLGSILLSNVLSPFIYSEVSEFVLRLLDKDVINISSTVIPKYCYTDIKVTDRIFRYRVNNVLDIHKVIHYILIYDKENSIEYIDEKYYFDILFLLDTISNETTHYDDLFAEIVCSLNEQYILKLLEIKVIALIIVSYCMDSLQHLLPLLREKFQLIFDHTSSGHKNVKECAFITYMYISLKYTENQNVEDIDRVIGLLLSKVITLKDLEYIYSLKDVLEKDVTLYSLRSYCLYHSIEIDDFTDVYTTIYTSIKEYLTNDKSNSSIEVYYYVMKENRYIRPKFVDSRLKDTAELNSVEETIETVYYWLNTIHSDHEYILSGLSSSSSKRRAYIFDNDDFLLSFLVTNQAITWRIVRDMRTDVSITIVDEMEGRIVLEKSYSNQRVFEIRHGSKRALCIGFNNKELKLLLIPIFEFKSLHDTDAESRLREKLKGGIDTTVYI